MPKNPKRDPLGLLNVFYKPKTKHFKGVPYDRIKPFGLLLLLEALKKFVVYCETRNPRSHACQTPEN